MGKKTYRYNKKGKKYSIKHMEKGDKILLAIHNNRIIEYQAFMRSSMELTFTWHLKLSPLTIYFYKEIMDNILGSIIKFLKQEHYDRGIGAVLMQNKLMLKVMSNLNKFEPMETILLFRFLEYEIPLISGKSLGFLKSNKIGLVKEK